MKTSIIIPFYNRWDLVHSRLSELYRYMPGNCEVVLVNDASPEDCRPGVAFWQKQLDLFPIRYVENKKNLGFGGSMNAGAEVALKYKADLIVLLSNDVVVSGDFVTGIKHLLKSDDELLIGNEVIWWPGGWNEFVVDGKKIVVPYANGWFLSCTSAVWKELGGFDLGYGRYDYEDIDLSTKALSIGYNIVALKSPFLRHLGAQTIVQIDGNRIQSTIRNREYYENKWLSKLSDFMAEDSTNGRGHKTTD